MKKKHFGLTKRVLSYALNLDGAEVSDYKPVVAMLNDGAA